MSKTIAQLEAELKQAEQAYARAYARLFDAKLASTAQQIVDAGEKRRGGGASAPPRDPLAAAIITAGKRRRGEIE